MPLGVQLRSPDSSKCLQQQSAGVPDAEPRRDFDRGDPVIIRNEEGIEMARGLSAYSSEDTNRIRGLKSSQTEEVLGYRGREEIIHRDDLIISKS